MKTFFVPSSGADDWKKFLAEPEKQWRIGFSARTLAHCWEDTDGFPLEIKSVFAKSNLSAFENVQMLMGFPEHKVDLPGGGRPSQNDLFVIAKSKDNELMTVTIEGKVSEPFGPTIAAWNPAESVGKTKRFEFLKNILGLMEIPPDIRYQLLHRSASAILEAQKFNAKRAVMLVHSFNPNMLWLDDFRAFTRLFGVDSEPDHLYFIKKIDQIDFYVSWVKGNLDFLSA